MAKDASPKHFRPRRPIYLSKDNTGHRSDEQVIESVEKLRDRGWLCAFQSDEKPVRSAHLSFDDPNMFQEFKRDLNTLGLQLKARVLSEEEEEQIEREEAAKSEPNESSERIVLAD